MGKFTDFARDEIYAFQRLTAILTTFFMAAGFTVFAFKEGELGCRIIRWSFYALAGTGAVNIGLVWWRLRRTIFKYYAKLDKYTPDELIVCNRIKKHAWTWQQVIWFTFLGCFIAFVVFLVGVLISL